jgi:hypothetical protein
LKAIITLFFITTTTLSIIIMGMSIGWMLVLFGIFFFLPVIVVHIMAGSRSLKRLPALRKEIIISSLSFLGMSLARFDMDDVDAYTGYSTLLYNLGLRESQYATPWGSFYYVSIALFVFLLFYDIKLMRKAKSPPAVPGPEDYV